MFGVGPDTAATLLVTAGSNPERLHSEAAFAALCGVSPRVLEHGVAIRLRYDPRTKAYMCRRTGEGMSKTEVIRCLKRYVAREVFSALQNSAAIISSAA